MFALGAAPHQPITFNELIRFGRLAKEYIYMACLYTKTEGLVIKAAKFRRILQTCCATITYAMVLIISE